MIADNNWLLHKSGLVTVLLAVSRGAVKVNVLSRNADSCGVCELCTTLQECYSAGTLEKVPTGWIGVLVRVMYGALFKRKSIPD